jgi:hypothetical protein
MQDLHNENKFTSPNPIGMEAGAVVPNHFMSDGSNEMTCSNVSRIMKKTNN